VYGAPAAPQWAVPSGQGPWGTGPGVYYAPPSKRGKRFWWIFASVTLVVLIGIGSLVGVVAVKVVGKVRTVLGPTVAATGYLNDLTDARYLSAYDRLCVADRHAVSLAKFTSAKTAHHPESYDISGIPDVATINGIKTATVDYRETSSDGSSNQAVLTLQDTATGWYICHPGQDPSEWAGSPNPTSSSGPELPAAYRRLVLSG
jgi:hypothetical protein